jgi:hypothetical protein
VVRRGTREVVGHGFYPLTAHARKITWLMTCDDAHFIHHKVKNVASDIHLFMILLKMWVVEFSLGMCSTDYRVWLDLSCT